MVRIMAATAARCLGAAWPRRLRAQCTRHRCRPALRTRRAAARRPSWSSAMTSLTPRSPRSASVRRNPVQKTSASEAPVATPRTSRRPSVLTPTATMTATLTIRPPCRDFSPGSGFAGPRPGSGGVDPQVGPMALDRSAEERLDALVPPQAAGRLGTPASMSSHRRETWLPRVRLRLPEGMLGDAGAAHGLDQVVDRTGRDPVHVSLLNDRGQSLLRGATWLQEGREVRSFAQLRDGQLDPADAGLPATLAVAVPVVDPLRAPHPGRGPGEPVDLGLHQPLARVGQQLANQVRIGTLLEQLQQRHSLVGHRRLRWVPGLATRTFTEDRR